MASSPVIIQVATPGPAGPTGPGGATGPAGYSPRYYVQPGPPSSGVGVALDMYLNSTNSDVWGPKIDNATWPATPACNIRGSTGATGYSPLYIVAAGAPAGATGNNGDMYINSTTSDLYGPKASGVWGGIVANLKGGTGPAGPPGVAYTPKGAWSSASVAYLLGDEVSDAGQVWICLVNHTSSAGNRPSTPTPAIWQSVGSGGMADPTTAKGDLIARGAAAPATRLPVGSNGQILIADSAQTLGVKWGANITQTPWTGNINGGGFTLANVSAIGIGMPSATYPLQIRMKTDQNVIFSGNGMPAMQWLNDALSAYIPVQYMASGHYFLQGNVGIGTTSAGQKLTVAGSLLLQDNTPQLMLAGSEAGGKTVGLYEYQGALYIDWQGNATLCSLNANNGNVIVGTSGLGGNVGIGTTVPAGRLHVYGNVPALGSGYTPSGSVGGSLLLDDTNIAGGAGGQIVFCAGNGAWQMAAIKGYAINGGGNSQGDIVFSTRRLQSDAAFTDTMRITAAGNVAIGTAAPQGRLSVVPSSNASTVAGANFLTIGESTNTAGYYMGLGYLTDAGVWKGSIQAFNAGGAGNLVLNGMGGGVAVGKTSPINYALDVGGEVNATGFRINGTPISTGGSGGVTVQTAGMANSSRFLGNPYQNTFSGGKPVLVTVTCNCNAAGTFWANCNSTNSFGAGNQVAQTTSQNASQVLSITFWVLPNYWYQVSSSGSLTLTYWTEWY